MYPIYTTLPRADSHVKVGEWFLPLLLISCQYFICRSWSSVWCSWWYLTLLENFPSDSLALVGWWFKCNSFYLIFYLPPLFHFPPLLLMDPLGKIDREYCSNPYNFFCAIQSLLFFSHSNYTWPLRYLLLIHTVLHIPFLSSHVVLFHLGSSLHSILFSVELYSSFFP